MKEVLSLNIFLNSSNPHGFVAIPDLVESHKQVLEKQYDLCQAINSGNFPAVRVS